MGTSDDPTLDPMADALLATALDDTGHATPVVDGTLPAAPTPGLEETAADTPGLDATAPGSASSARTARQRMGDYEILGEVARGGMGRILRARDERINRVVAIKELLSDNRGLERRFYREAMISARLQHPSIVPVYEVGQHAGKPYYAMKLVPGRPLDQVIADRSTVAERVALVPAVIAVVDALAYAHARGVVHRDLKPANVLIGEYGETVVVDWGLAKHLGDGDVDVQEPLVSSDLQDNLTMMGSAMGTPAYMPPEQARGDAADERSDVYSLGAILYQTLTGKIPYHDSKSAQHALSRVKAEPPVSIAALAEGVPSDLIAIVDKAMARDPEARYASAQQLAADLRRFEAGQLVSAREYSFGVVLSRWLRKHRLAVSVATIALLVLSVVAVASVIRIRSERDNAEREHTRAEASITRLLVDRGRSELADGRRLRAATLLAAAYERGDTSEGVRLALGASMRALAGIEWVHPGHRRLGFGAAFAHRSSRLVTTSIAGDAKQWSADGRPEASVETGSRGAWAIWSPDDRRLIVASAASPAGVKIWDARTKTLERELAITHRGRGVLAAHHQTLFVQTRQGVVEAWDLARHEKVRTFGEPRPVGSTIPFGVEWSLAADGKRLVHGKDRTVRVYDTSTGAILHEHATDAAIEGVTAGPGDRFGWWSKSGDLELREAGAQRWRVSVAGARWLQFARETLLAQTERELLFINPKDGVIARRFATTALGPAVVSGDGERVAVVAGDAVHVYDCEHAIQIATLDTLGSNATQVSFNADATRLAAIHIDGSVTVWRLRDAIGLELLRDVTPSADGSLYAQRRDGHWIITDTATDQVVGKVAREAKAVGLGAHRRRVVAVLSNGSLVIHHTDGGTIVRVPGPRPVDAANVWITADGGHALLVTRDTETRKPRSSVIDTNTGRELLASNSFLSRRVLAPNGRHIAFARGATQIQRIGSDATCKVAHSASAAPAVFFPDSERVLAPVLLKGAVIADVECRVLHRLKHQMAFVAGLSGDGKVVATGAGDGSVKVWAADTGQLRNAFPTTAPRVEHLSLNHDGTLIAVTMRSGETLLVLRTSNGELLARHPCRGICGMPTIFHPSQDVLLSGGKNQATARVHVPRETRSPAAVGALIERFSPWHLDGLRLKRREAADSDRASRATPLNAR